MSQDSLTLGSNRERSSLSPNPKSLGALGTRISELRAGALTFTIGAIKSSSTDTQHPT